jgi:predicted ArsR family transcriptional regulator
LLEPPGGETPTRERVARSILENGPSSAAALAERLGLTPAGVRRHLDHLLAEGALEAREPRVYGHRSRGRPAKVFALTDSGRDEFFQAYDDLAASALRFLSETAGEQAVSTFAHQLVAELEERYRSDVTSAPEEERARVLADALTGDGYAASVQSSLIGARWRTSPRSSRSCAKPRRKCSPDSWGGTSSGLPPSPTAMGSALPTSPTPRRPA